MTATFKEYYDLIKYFFSFLFFAFRSAVLKVPAVKGLRFKIRYVHWHTTSKICIRQIRNPIPFAITVNPNLYIKKEISKMIPRVEIINLF